MVCVDLDSDSVAGRKKHWREALRRSRFSLDRSLRWFSLCRFRATAAGLCSMVFEQPDGQLNQRGARIDSFRGVIGWAGLQAGRPWGLNGALRDRVLVQYGPGDGLIDPCVGP